MGRALSKELLNRGHAVEVLARAGSENRSAAGAIVHVGDPLNGASYAHLLRADHTIVQLVGVAHPGPLKKEQFRKIDFVCGRESVTAAAGAGVEQLVYVSVAQPAPIMKAYIEARADVENLIRLNKLNASILRPWYVIGPGRRWPLLFLPLYWIFENQSATRESAQRLGLVTIKQMVQALTRAIENPPKGVRVWEVPQIRAR